MGYVDPLLVTPSQKVKILYTIKPSITFTCWMFDEKIDKIDVKRHSKKTNL